MAEQMRRVREESTGRWVGGTHRLAHRATAEALAVGRSRSGRGRRSIVMAGERTIMIRPSLFLADMAVDSSEVDALENHDDDVVLMFDAALSSSAGAIWLPLRSDAG